MIRFIDRKEELDLLERAWEQDRAEFIVITGRRRIGKTRMMLEFMKGKEGIFYIAEDVSKKVQIDEFRTRIALYLEDEFLKNTEIREWRALFSYLEKAMPKNKRMYITIDEFSYLIRNDPSILSALQIFWDTFLSKTRVFLIISGSLLGLMQESVLSSASPLYGRRTRDILLEPMRFTDSMDFLNMKLEDAMKVYMSVGGVPEYLLRASSYSTADEFLKAEFFRTSGYFYREPYFILSQEFREIRKYFSILSAVSLGNTKASEIANFAGMNSREIYPYLENLIRLGFLRRVIPMEGKKKTGIYILKDPMLDMWFNTVYPNREAIERGDFVPEKPFINMHYGKRFEILVRDEIFHRFFSYPETGIWWHRDTEVDIVGIDRKKKKVIFGECKWRDGVNGYKIFEDLRKKAEKFPYDAKDEKYVIFARSFKNRPDSCICLDLKDIEKEYGRT
jgi:AAA+ ATPase superfamily predicted ATPase